MALDKRRIAGLVVAEMAGAGALALLFYYLAVSGADRIADVWAVDRVVAYALLFVGPMLVLLPPCLMLRLGPVWLLGAGSWALLGYVLVFVGAPTRQNTSFFTYIAFLTLLFVALTATFAVPLGALSKRFLPAAGQTTEMVRALREGGLLALFVVSLIAMSPLNVLNWLNALLVFTIVSLTEFFFLARD